MTLEESRALKDPWAFWKAAMRGEMLNTHPHFVPIGFYRLDTAAKEKKPATSYPVAIWIDGPSGDKMARVSHAKTVVFSTPAAEEDFGLDTFSRCCRAPISYEAYVYWMEHRAWPPEQVADALTASHPDRTNSGAAPDVVLRETIAELRAEADKWLESIGGKVRDQDEANKAADFASRFSELEKEAEEARNAARKPHMEAAAAEQATWHPIVTAGAASKTWAKALTVAWQMAERTRILQEAAAKAAAGEAVSLGNLSVKAGTRGRAVSLRSREVATVTDWDVLFAFYRDQQRFRELDIVKAALTQLAKSDLHAGTAVPGAKLEKIESAA